MKAGHFDLAGSWTSRNKNAVFFAEIQIRCKFFSSSPRRKPLLPLWEIGSKKKSIISPSNRAICAELRGTSGFPLVPVTTVAPTNPLTRLLPPPRQGTNMTLALCEGSRVQVGNERITITMGVCFSEMMKRVYYSVHKTKL